MVSFFELLKTSGKARRGRLKLPHGTVETPVFMPVATRGTVVALSPEDVSTLGFEMMLSNAYHLHLRPGSVYINEMGGLQHFVHWDKPILTDSGGYQIFSFKDMEPIGKSKQAGKLPGARITDEGVEFRSPLDGKKEFFTPEKVVEIQENLGSDIAMVLDECPPFTEDEKLLRASVERTTFWAGRARRYRKSLDSENAQFGIVQGGVNCEWRKRSAGEIAALDFDGYGIGGIGLGESREQWCEVLETLNPILPVEKPRYLMGMGTPDDLVEAVARGVDMFDCVVPTRNARNGTLYTSRGKISIKSLEYEKETGPADPACGCPTCSKYSTAYLRFLWKRSEPSVHRLMTIHNLYYYAALMREMREVIEAGCFEVWKQKRGRAAEIG